MNNPGAPKPKKENSKTTNVIAVLILLALAYGIFSLFSGGSKPASNKQSDNASQASTVSTIPASQNGTSAQVTAWVAKYGTIFQTLQNDFNKMSTDAGNQDVSVVGSDCQQINTDVQTAQSYPAIPDAQTASDFSSALSYYETGSKDCVTAVSNNDASGLTQASNELTQGTDKITATNNDIKNIGG